MGLLVINVGKIRGGRVVKFKRRIWGTGNWEGGGEWVGVHH